MLNPIMLGGGGVGGIAPGDFTVSVTADADNGRWSVVGSDFQSAAGGQPMYLGDWIGGGGRASNNWYRFQNLTIPTGATIDIATLTVIGYQGTANSCNTKVHANDIADAVSPTNLAEAVALALTTAYVDWAPIPAFTNGVSYSPSDLSAVIQEVVDIPGRSATFDLMILVMNNASSSAAWRRPKAYYDGPSNAPSLYIAYS